MADKQREAMIEAAENYRAGLSEVDDIEPALVMAGFALEQVRKREAELLQNPDLKMVLSYEAGQRNARAEIVKELRRIVDAGNACGCNSHLCLPVFIESLEGNGEGGQDG